MHSTNTPTFRIVSTGQLQAGFIPEQACEALSKRLKLQPNQLTKQIPVYLGGTERSLRAYAVEWKVVKENEELSAAGLAPLSVLEIARQSGRLRDHCYRSMAELARLVKRVGVKFGTELGRTMVG